MVQPGVIFIRRPPRLLTGSFASTRTPWCRHVLSVPPRNLRPSFEAQTRKPAIDGFEAQTTKPLASSVLHTRLPPMVLRTKPPNPRCRRVSDLPPSMTHLPSSLTRPTSLCQVPQRHRLHLDLADIVFITMYTYTRRCPKCQPSRLVTRPLGPSVQVSRPPFTTPSSSAWHVLLDLHLTVDYRLHAPHVHTMSQETCTHSFRQGRVSHHSTYFVDHIDNHSSQNEHIRVLVNLIFTISPLMSALSTPIHE
jgi:hypothetical protein